MTYRKRKTRIHLTTGEESSKWNKAHKVCFCGESYDTFTGPYNHTVYTVWALISGVFGNTEQKDLCPNCMANPDLGIAILNAQEDLPCTL